jgi:hypothetical protein
MKSAAKPRKTAPPPETAPPVPPDAARIAALYEDTAHLQPFYHLTMWLPDAERETLVRQILTVARSNLIMGSEERAAALMSVAPCLPETERAAILREVLETATSPDPFLRGVLDKYESKALVENREKPPYNPAMALLNNYLKSLGVAESRQPELAAKIDAFARAEITGHEAAPVEALPFAAALEAMTLKERRAALIEHYGLVPDKDGTYALPEKKQWKNVRAENPKPEQFREWLDVVFPDREAIGMVLSDLKHLDPPAHVKLHNWSQNPKTKSSIDSFGLPSKRISYDPKRDANAPASFAEVVARAERGEGSFKKLSRSFQRAQYHARAG